MRFYFCDHYTKEIFEIQKKFGNTVLWNCKQRSNLSIPRTKPGPRDRRADSRLSGPTTARASESRLCCAPLCTTGATESRLCFSTSELNARDTGVHIRGENCYSCQRWINLKMHQHITVLKNVCSMAITIKLCTPQIQDFFSCSLIFLLSLLHSIMTQHTD